MKIKRLSVYNILIILVLILSLCAYEIHLHKFYSYFQILCSFLLFLLILIVGKDQHLKHKFKNLMMLNPTLLILLGFMLSNTIIGYIQFKLNTFKGILSVAMLVFTSLSLFYTIPLICKDNKIIENKIFKMFIFSSTFLSFFSVLQKVFNGSFMGYGLVNFRISSMFYDPNFLATVLGVSFVFILIRKEGMLSKLFLLLLHGYAIYLSGSRGALLSLVLTLIIYSLVFSKISVMKKIIITILLSIVAIMFLRYLLYQTTFFRVYQGDNYRIEMISYAVKQVSKSPIFGYGYQSISNSLDNLDGRASVHASTHNSYIDYLFSYGIPVFVIYVLFLFGIILKGFFCRSKEVRTYIIISIFLLINANTILYSFGGVGILSIMFTLTIGLLNINVLNEGQVKKLNGV